MGKFSTKHIVPSGQALFTTLGNTLRLLLFYKYVSWKHGVYFEPIVSGDDVMLVCERGS